MESGSGFNEEDYMSTKAKLAFSYSSSSSPSSSSSQQKVRPVITLPDIYEKHRMGSWLGSKYDPEEDNETGTTTTAAAAAKIELMDVTTVADEEGVRREGSGRGGGESSSVVAIEKEHMFDKVVTPSDVGKLNRLVIPKQHAEKYFPLDASTNEKGLLLNFEDSKGKEWRFRYSYWNSSQSYVMTKGWSRFVKEKKLDAGDIVSFQRGLGESGKDRLYIDWRRRPDALPPLDPTSQNHYYHHHHYFSPATWSPLLARQPPAAVPLAPRDHFHLSNLDRNASYGSFGYNSTNYSNVVTANPSGSINFLMRSAAGAPQQQGVGMGMVQWQPPQTMVYESVPVVQGKAAAKRLRLFGVNMDCPIGNESASGNHHHQYDQCDKILSSTSTMPPHVAAMAALQHPQISLQSQFPPHLRLYNGTPVSSSTHQFLYNEKQPAASMSLDLDI